MVELLGRERYEGDVESRGRIKAHTCSEVPAGHMRGKNKQDHAEL